jgi:hypothetical protein
MKRYPCWAIRLGPEDGGGYMGIYWWFDEPPPHIRPAQSGCLTALWATRAAARKALPSVTRTITSARVVRVNVTITERGEE